jgi:hypothetical protein
MQIIACDLCKKQITELRWATISFPRIVDGDMIVEFYKESDVCGKCLIELTKHTKVTMIERKPVSQNTETVDEAKPKS